MSSSLSLIITLLPIILIVAARVVRRRSSVLHPRARAYAHSLTVAIYDYLCTPHIEDSFLLSLTPTPRERRALAEVVATLSRCVAECDPARLKALSKAWGLEEVLLARALSYGSGRRLEALTTLLYLHPSADTTQRIARCPFASPAECLAQLLLAIYASPQRVVELLWRHSTALTWGEMERVVGVLKMRCGRLTEPDYGTLRGCHNVEMLALYLSAVEGVGSARTIAEALTTHPNPTLRTAAYNVLLGERLFPPLKGHNVGC